jgi:ABC-2 type transport system permease protein
MRQALVIARYDLRRQWRDRSLFVTTGVLVLLLAAASLLGVAADRDARDTAAWLTTRLEQSEAEVQRLAVAAAPDITSQLPWDALNPAFLANDRGTLAIAAPPPLLRLSVGQTGVYPAQVKVTASGRDVATTAVEIAHPLWLSTGAFDVEFVLVFLWPLAILAATFDLSATDRERGTLSLILAQPVAAAAFLGGTLIARGGMVLVPAVALPWLTLLGSHRPGVAPIVLWSATVVAYGVFWMGLSVWVNAKARSAVANAVWLGGAWLLLTLVIPGASHLAMTTWGAVPSDVVFADATRAATRDALSDGSRVLGHFLEDHPTASAVGRDGLRQYALLQAARDEEVAQRLAPVVARYQAAVETQLRIASLAQFLSPAMVVSSVLQQAAGTSRDRADDFAAQVAAFREGWRAFFQPRILRNLALTREDAALLPRFAYREPAWTVTAGRVLPGLLAVVAVGLGLLWLGARRWAGSSLVGAGA